MKQIAVIFLIELNLVFYLRNTVKLKVKMLKQIIITINKDVE